MDNIIDFGKAKLKRQRKQYEDNLDTQIITTRREIEAIALDSVFVVTLHE